MKVSRHVSQGPGGGTENWVPIGRRFFKCLGNVPQLHCADGYTTYTYIKVTDMDTKGHTSCSVNCRSRNLSTESDQSDPEATVPSLVWAPCQLTTLGPEGCWCWGQGLLGDWKRISQHRAWQRGETEQYLHHPGQLTWGLDSVAVPDLQPRGQILLWDTRPLHCLGFVPGEPQLQHRTYTTIGKNKFIKWNAPRRKHGTNEHRTYSSMLWVIHTGFKKEMKGPVLWHSG